jgi:hypothetical protein
MTARSLDGRAVMQAGCEAVVQLNLWCSACDPHVLQPSICTCYTLAITTTSPAPGNDKESTIVPEQSQPFLSLLETRSKWQINLSWQILNVQVRLDPLQCRSKSVNENPMSLGE